MIGSECKAKAHESAKAAEKLDKFGFSQKQEPIQGPGCFWKHAFQCRAEEHLYNMCTDLLVLQRQRRKHSRQERGFLGCDWFQHASFILTGPCAYLCVPNSRPIVFCKATDFRGTVSEVAPLRN